MPMHPTPLYDASTVRVFIQPPSKASKVAGLASASSSTATLVHPALPITKGAQKNYAAAFGELQSTYGFGGATPGPTPRRKIFKDASKRSTLRSFFRVRSSSSTSSDRPGPEPSAAPAVEKDYSGAFGQLSSSYGFGGAAPAVPGKNLRPNSRLEK